MRIVRADSPYKTINTTIATDSRVSWQARGVAFYLLATGGDISPEAIVEQSKQSELPISLHVARQIIDELVESGYELEE
jgi:hypothetical protein